MKTRSSSGEGFTKKDCKAFLEDLGMRGGGDEGSAGTSQQEGPPPGWRSSAEWHTWMAALDEALGAGDGVPPSSPGPDAASEDDLSSLAPLAPSHETRGASPRDADQKESPGPTARVEGTDLSRITQAPSSPSAAFKLFGGRDFPSSGEGSCSPRQGGSPKSVPVRSLDLVTEAANFRSKVEAELVGGRKRLPQASSNGSAPGATELEGATSTATPDDQMAQSSPRSGSDKFFSDSDDDGDEESDDRPGGRRIPPHILAQVQKYGFWFSTKELKSTPS
jgi:hypothetical protein